MIAAIPGFCVIVLFGLFPFLSLVASQQAPIALILISIFLALAAVMRWLTERDAGKFFRPNRDETVWIGIAGICLLYVAASCLWSIGLDQSLERVQRWGLLVAMVLAALFAVRRLPGPPPGLWIVTVVPLILLGLAIIGEGVFGLLSATVFAEYSAFKQAQILNRPSTYFAMLAWPAAYALFKTGRIGVSRALAVASPLTLFVTNSGSAALAAIVALLAFILTSVNRKGAGIGLGILLFATFLGMPFLVTNPAIVKAGVVQAGEQGAFSAAHRLGIWNFVGSRIFEAPVLGLGVNTARMMPGASQPLRNVESFAPYIDLVRDKFPTLEAAQALPLHPHNGALQLHVELGAVGVLLFCLAATFGMVSFIRDRSTGIAPYGIAWMASWTTIAFFSVGFWQTWWWALSSVCLIQFALLRQAEKAVDQPAQISAHSSSGADRPAETQ